MVLLHILCAAQILVSLDHLVEFDAAAWVQQVAFFSFLPPGGNFLHIAASVQQRFGCILVGLASAGGNFRVKFLNFEESTPCCKIFWGVGSWGGGGGGGRGGWLVIKFPLP